MELVTLDVYTEFASETEGKIKALTARLAELEKNLSNPSELINYTCKLATNLVKTWDLGDYYQKQVFQNTLFPSGLGYDAKTEQYRTTTVNSVFALITELSKVSYLSEKKTSQDLPEKSDLVPGIGVEPIRYCYHWCLRPARLPIPPPGRLIKRLAKLQFVFNTSKNKIVAKT